MKVVLAEDDEITRLLLESILTKWGYDVIVTHDGKQAYDQLQAINESCFAILDWVMPEMDGVEACRKIRENNSSQNYIYIVMITGRQSKKDLLESLSAGADDFLTKPFDHQELEIRLRAGRRILDLQERLKKLAYFDYMTSLMNRMAIMECLNKEIARVIRYSSDLSILMADLDHFKQVNDTYGHLAGDAVLQDIGTRIRKALRTYDSIGRYGGEEFLIILPGCERRQAIPIADRVLETVRDTPVQYKKQFINVTISLGIADKHSISDFTDDSFLQAADHALYQAKTEGRNRYCVAPWLPVPADPVFFKPGF